MGVRSDSEKGSVEEAAWELGMITDANPSSPRPRRAFANFKLREGQSVGCKVTLRREVMYEFLDRTWSPRRCRAFVTSGASRRANLMAGAPIYLGFLTKPFSLRSNSGTRSSGNRAWMSPLSRPPTRMKRPAISCR